MGLFSKRKIATSTTVPEHNRTAELLDGYGKASLESMSTSNPITDPNYTYDMFLGPWRIVITESAHGLDSLYDNAKYSKDATFGAYRVLSDLNLSFTNLTQSDPRFLEILDLSLGYLKSLGFSSGHLNRYEADRWLDTHEGFLRTSFDGYIERPVSSEERISHSKGPEIGQIKKVALTGPQSWANEFYARINKSCGFPLLGFMSIFSHLYIVAASNSFCHRSRIEVPPPVYIKTSDSHYLRLRKAHAIL